MERGKRMWEERKANEGEREKTGGEACTQTKTKTTNILINYPQIGLLSDIDLMHHPELIALLKDGETAEDLLKLGPEAILLR